MSTRVDIDLHRNALTCAHAVRKLARVVWCAGARPRGHNPGHISRMRLYSGVVGETRQLRNNISLAIPLPLDSGGL